MASSNTRSATPPGEFTDQDLVQTLRNSTGRRVFDRFRLKVELGQGGMGVVWLAEDERLNGRLVALKFLPGLVVSDAEALNDLRKEIVHGLDINHPGVVRMYDLHQDDATKLAAIAMEYVEGHNLSELKNEKPARCFDTDELLPLLKQLCDVLAYLHEDAGVIHRDLKPRNVMVNKKGRVKLADFGIAAAITESHSRLTRVGSTSGTICYMSPQQLGGRSPRVSDDFYALGATIYELMTGKPPFFRGAAAAIMYQVQSTIPPSMAARREELGVTGMDAIPSKWEDAVAACLAKEPDERPAKCADLLERLVSELNDVECPACQANLEVLMDEFVSCPVCECEFEMRSPNGDLYLRPEPLEIVCPICRNDSMSVRESGVYECPVCEVVTDFTREDDEVMFDLDAVEELARAIPSRMFLKGCPWCEEVLELPGFTDIICPFCTCEFEYNPVRDENFWNETPLEVECPICHAPEGILVQESKSYQCAACQQFTSFERNGDQAMYDLPKLRPRAKQKK